jgi:DinB family protein
MIVLSKHAFLSGLIDRTEVITSNTQPLLRLSEEELNFKPEPDTWSIAEIFGHLNIANSRYIRSILERINTAPDISTANYYKGGWLGDWVYEKLMPRADGSVFKINSTKLFCPLTGNHTAKEVLRQFLEHQNEVHDILLHASTKDLVRIRIPFYLTGIFSFRLGDTLRFMIAHNERHLLQAHRMLKKNAAFQNG